MIPPPLFVLRKHPVDFMVGAVVAVIIWLCVGCTTAPVATPPTVATTNRPATSPPPMPAVTANAATISRPALHALVQIVPDHETDCALGWDLDTQSGITSIGLMYGNRSGEYKYRIDVEPDMTNFTVGNLDDRLPWYFACVASITNDPPVTNCVPFGTGQACTTLYNLNSANSDEAMYCTSNLIPYLVLAGQMATVTFWGSQGQVYTVLTNTVDGYMGDAAVAGSNGPLQVHLQIGTNSMELFQVVEEPIQ